MNNLATITAPLSLPASAPAITLPPEVRVAVQQVLTPDPNAGRRVPALSNEMRDWARTCVTEMDRRAAPANVRTVRTWLVPVSIAVRNPPHPEDVAAFSGLLTAVCSDLPGWAFNHRTQRDAVLKFQFWPAIADIRKLLEEEALPMTETARALRELVKAEADHLDEVFRRHRVAEAERTAKILARAVPPANVSVSGVVVALARQLTAQDGRPYPQPEQTYATK